LNCFNARESASANAGETRAFVKQTYPSVAFSENANGVALMGANFLIPISHNRQTAALWERSGTS